MECKLILGDCLEKVKELPNESVDLVLTDFPYGISFMGKDWDNVNENFYFNVAKMLLPKMKAGAFLVTTFTPRQDMLWRCLAGLEKAGFELNTTSLYHLYHTGFPKSLDISKAADKHLPCKNLQKDISNELKKARTKTKYSQDNLCRLLKLNDIGHGGMVNHWENYRQIPTPKQWIEICKLLPIENKFNDFFEKYRNGLERDIIKKGENPITWFYKEYNITAPASKEAHKWQGWKSFQPKPALECIIVAQKPKNQKTIVGQVLENGCGAVNIGECRIPYKNGSDINFIENHLNKYGNKDYAKNSNTKFGQIKSNIICGSTDGRFPTNLLVSGEPLKGKESKGFYRPNVVNKDYAKDGNYFVDNKYSENVMKRSSMHNDSGSPNRFYDIDRWAEKRNITLTEDSALFDVPKPSKNEKNNELDYLPIGQTTGGGGMNNERLAHAFGSKKAKQHNIHPTCKPTTLFRYLATLFCQPNGTVLDPFMGSGTTGIACLMENKNFIGIEKDPEYFKIAQARIKPFKDQQRLF